MSNRFPNVAAGKHREAGRPRTIGGSLMAAAAGALVALGLCATRLPADNLAYNLSGDLAIVFTNESGAPIIRAQPRPAVAPTNGSVVFAVIAAGTPPLTFYWQLNSNHLSVANSATLVLTNLTLAQFGAYRVIVSNAFGSVTSSNALLELDSDRDGIADSWETNYFTSITNRSGAEDYDQDGIPDRDEFLEGTHPRFSSVLNPRVTIVSDHGEVLVTPNIPLFTNGQTITLTGVPDPGLQFLGYLANAPSYSIFAMRTNPAQVKLTSSLTVRAIFGLSVTNSLDVTNGWRIDQGGWFGQTNITHDGVDAMQSARLLDLSEAWLELTNVVLATEGTITFWWKVDGVPPSVLRFYRNSVLRSGEIGTNTDWQQRTYYLPAGTNVVRWLYKNNSDQVSEYNGLYYAPADAGWVDQVSYAVWPNPSLDADADGMPDIWEFRYFDGTGEAPTTDYDRDGISNKDEFLDGTNPDNNASYFPRLTVFTSGGNVVKNPDLPKYTLNQIVQLQAVPDPTNYFVIWTGAVSGTNLTNSITMNGNKTITAVFGSPLSDALEAPALPWTRGGVIGFFGQTNYSRDGADAAQSGPVGFRQESWMETSVTGPGTLSFWWKTLSTTNQNFIRLLVNGAEQPSRISGNTDWQPQSYFFGAGTHTLRWAYSNNTSVVSLTNGAWVDQVSYTPGAVAPQIVQQPASVLTLPGSNVVFTVAATGTPPLRYQWFRNSFSLGATATNTTLTVSNVSSLQAGSYVVQISNSVQVVPSSPATLTVLPIPPANDNFANRALLPGTNAVLGYLHGATREFGETNHAFTFGGRSVWWRWTAPSNGNYQLVAVGTNVFSSLVAAVYTGNAVNVLTEIKSGLDTPLSVNGTDLSLVAFTFSAVGGTTYAIAVDHSFGDEGFFSLTIQRALPPLLGGTSYTSGGAFAFAFSAPPGASYIIESSDDLQIWLPVTSGIVPASGLVAHSEPVASNLLRSFYRIRLP